MSEFQDLTRKSKKNKQLMQQFQVLGIAHALVFLLSLLVDDEHDENSMEHD